MDCQFISIYGKFVRSKTVSFSRADINGGRVRHWHHCMVIHKHLMDRSNIFSTGAIATIHATVSYGANGNRQ